MQTNPNLRRAYRGFYKASRTRNLDRMVDLIPENPAVVDCDGSAGALIEIVEMETPEFLEPLLQAGMKPDSDSETCAQTQLQKAAADGEVEKMRLLIRYGADLERRNNAGEVALGYACSWGQFEAVKILVEAGADVNVIEQDPESGYRNTPLDCAIHQYPEITDYLRANGARLLSEIEG